MYINRSTVSLSIIILIQNRVKDRCDHTGMILSTVTPGYSTDTAGGTTMISSIRIHTPGQLKVGAGKVYLPWRLRVDNMQTSQEAGI